MVNAALNGERLVNAMFTTQNADSCAGFWQKNRNGERVNTIVRHSRSLAYICGGRHYAFTRSPNIYISIKSLIIRLVLSGEHPVHHPFTMFTTPLDDAHLHQTKHRRYRIDDAEDGFPRFIGPTCADCRFWQPPYAGEKFGFCHRVVCVRKRHRSIEIGTLVSLDELRQRHLHLDHEPMTTRSWTPACSLFTEKDNA